MDDLPHAGMRDGESLVADASSSGQPTSRSRSTVRTPCSSCCASDVPVAPPPACRRARARRSCAWRARPARRRRASGAERAALDRLAGTPAPSGCGRGRAAVPVRAARGPPRTDVPEPRAARRRQDPRNLGAILRTARAAGVGGVVVPQDRSVGDHPGGGRRVGRTASSASRSRGSRTSSGRWRRSRRQDSGWWASSRGRQRPLWSLDAPRAAGAGASAERARGCGRWSGRPATSRSSLPMASGVESLNVAVAAGVALYELLVRRATRPETPSGGDVSLTAPWPRC